LPANVIMNDGLYPASEIDAHYKGLEGTLAPLGHPTLNGEFISAFEAEAINAHHIGAFNRNVKKSGNRVYVEKWVDVEVAQRTEEGRELLGRVEALEKGEDVPPIHTSVAVFLDRETVTNAEGYEWIARIRKMDHDAILLDEPGAATPEQGVGLMVNADLAVPLQRPLAANAGILGGDSMRDREARLDEAARARFAEGEDGWAHVADFDESQAVVVRSSPNGGLAEVYDYTIENNVITFGATGTPVERQTTWVSKIPVINRLVKFFTNRQARPDTTEKEGAMPLTPEEKAELVKDIGDAVAANVAEQIKPIAEKVDALEANHKTLSDSLTANQQAEEAEKRAAVLAKFGEVVANSLSGAALDEMHKQCGTVAPVANGRTAPTAEGAPDPVAYFGGAK